MVGTNVTKDFSNVGWYHVTDWIFGLSRIWTEINANQMS